MDSQDQNASGVWAVPGVAEEAKLTLIRWRILKVPTNDRYLVGFCAERNEGRVSTAIVEVDVTRMVCNTVSGRIYRLEGEPGEDRDGDFIWRAAMRAREVDGWTDVSAQVWALHCRIQAAQ